MESESIRYNIIDKVLDVPLQNDEYPDFLMGAYKTVHVTWVAEHAIIYYPSLKSITENPLLRINSACLTGDIFGDNRCECNEQLIKAFDLIKEDFGIVIYHFHHEGRGLGFTSKLHTYKNMLENNVDTFEASRQISNKIDLRSYGSAVLILRDLGISKVRLITNNPDKKLVLETNGIEVSETIGLVSERPDLKRYLQSKKEKQGHFIDFKILNSK